jgi:DNA ligase (NAD+)
VSGGATAADVARRADELRRQIERANHAYYVLDAPEISDAEYDRFFRELQALEDAHPGLRTPDSPTQRVGTAPASALIKYRHRRIMPSLANAFSTDELVAWEERNVRHAGRRNDRLYDRGEDRRGRGEPDLPGWPARRRRY